LFGLRGDRTNREAAPAQSPDFSDDGAVERRAAETDPLGARSVEAGADALDDEAALELGQASESA
jgi:hypothetical protein